MKSSILLLSMLTINYNCMAQDLESEIKKAVADQDIKGQVKQAINNETQLRTVKSQQKSVYKDDSFDGINWSGKNRSGFVFSGVDFDDSDLSGADFSYAVFSNTDFHGSNLDDACFYGASFSNTDIHEDNSLVNTNLSNTKQSNFDITAESKNIIWKNTPCGARHVNK